MQNSNDENPVNVTFNSTSFDQAEEDDGLRNFKVHLRIQKRSGRKTITIVEGLPANINSKKILKILRKSLYCNGSLQKDAEDNQIIQLTGDQRENVAKMFVEEGIVADKSYIVMHGY